MTLQEAIKSGYPFMRPYWKSNRYGQKPWVQAQGDGFIHFVDSREEWKPYAKDLDPKVKDYIVKYPDTHVWAIQPLKNGKWEIAPELLTVEEIENLGYEVGEDAVRLELKENLKS